MTKDKNDPKKTTKSTKKAPVKSTNKVASKNTNKTTTSAKKGNATKKAVNTKTVVKKETKIVEPIETTVASSESTKKANNRNIIAKIKGFIQKNWEEKREFSIACIVIVVLVAIIIVLAVSKRIPKLKDGEEIIASIDGLNITSNDLYSDLKNSYGTDQLINMIDEYIADDYVTEFTDEDEEYVDQVVDYYKQYADYYGTSFEEFLTSYVGISGVSTEDEFREFVKKDYKKTLAVQKYVGSTISEDELKDEFEENYKEQLTVRHILIEVDDETTEEEAKKQAEDLIAQLDEVKDDADALEEKFEDLAYDNSADQATYEDGGLLEDFSKGEVDENFYDAAQALEDGEYTAEPVKSEYGYHVILKVSSKTNKYADVKEEIRTTLAKEMLMDDETLQITAWDKLRKEYNLKINDTDIKKTYQQVITDATSTDSSDTESSSSDSEDSSSEE